VRATLTDETGSVYFRGAETLVVTRDVRWQARLSFYTRHGDWFLVGCACLCAVAFWIAVILRPPVLPGSGESAF